MTWTKEEREAIAAAQKMYLDADAGSVEWRDYDATVEMLSYTLGKSMAETYLIVEEGPIITG